MEGSAGSNRSVPLLLKAVLHNSFRLSVKVCINMYMYSFKTVILTCHLLYRFKLGLN